MKNLILAAVIVAAAAFSPALALDQQPTPGGTVDVVETEATGQVNKIDKANRKVTFKDQDDRNVTVRVPDGQDIDKISKGSIVDVRYAESAALAIGKPGAPLGMENQTVELAPQSGQPNLQANTQTLTSTIEDIDRSNRTLTVLAPDGNKLRLQVPQGTPGFDTAKIGDSVAINYTDAVLLSTPKNHNK